METLELMATDQDAYTAWTRSIGRVIKAKEELNGNEALMATSTKVAVTKVEAIVQAANVTSTK